MDSKNSLGGAGIGGGYSENSLNTTQKNYWVSKKDYKFPSFTAGNITINSGTVIANGGVQSAGIGGRSWWSSY